MDSSKSMLTCASVVRQLRIKTGVDRGERSCKGLRTARAPTQHSTSDSASHRGLKNVKRGDDSCKGLRSAGASHTNDLSNSSRKTSGGGRLATARMPICLSSHDEERSKRSSRNKSRSQGHLKSEKSLRSKKSAQAKKSALDVSLNLVLAALGIRPFSDRCGH